MVFIHMAPNEDGFGSTHGVVKLKFVKQSSSSCSKWTWKDKKHSACQKPICKFILKYQCVFSLDVNKILRLQVTLNSRYAKNVIRYSFFRIFAEGQESHVSQTV